MQSPSMNQHLRSRRQSTITLIANRVWCYTLHAVQVKFHHRRRSPLAKLYFYMFSGCSVSASRGNFPDMFNEQVWKKYFIVVRSHQTFFFSQTCSLNKSGKIFDTMGVRGGGVHFPDMFIKNIDFFKPIFFQMGGVWVVVCIGVGSPKASLFQNEKLKSFGLGVWGSSNFFQFCLGFGLNFGTLGVLASALKRRRPACGRRWSQHASGFYPFLQNPPLFANIEIDSAGFRRKIRLFHGFNLGVPAKFL